MVDALVGEYADGGGIEDVNMLAFALVDHIEFNNPKGLLAEAGLRVRRRRARVCHGLLQGRGAARMYAAIAESMPDLARQAIITAFLHKNPRRGTTTTSRWTSCRPMMTATISTMKTGERRLRPDVRSGWRVSMSEKAICPR
jgi:hypothetical protein